jgi:hypothetical protein
MLDATAYKKILFRFSARYMVIEKNRPALKRGLNSAAATRQGMEHHIFKAIKRAESGRTFS